MTAAIALTNDCTDTRWFHRLIWRAQRRASGFPSSRVRFILAARRRRRAQPGARRCSTSATPSGASRASSATRARCCAGRRGSRRGGQLALGHVLAVVQLDGAPSSIGTGTPIPIAAKRTEPMSSVGRSMSSTLARPCMRGWSSATPEGASWASAARAGSGRRGGRDAGAGARPRSSPCRREAVPYPYYVTVTGYPLTLTHGRISRAGAGVEGDAAVGNHSPLPGEQCSC